MEDAASISGIAVLMTHRSANTGYMTAYMVNGKMKSYRTQLKEEVLRVSCTSFACEKEEI